MDVGFWFYEKTAVVYDFFMSPCALDCGAPSFVLFLSFKRQSPHGDGKALT